MAGNILVGDIVGRAASAAFDSSAGLELGERLVRALEAALASGGEPEPLRSACLRVHGSEQFPLVDLRVDEHPDPLRELRRLWELYGLRPASMSAPRNRSRRRTWCRPRSGGSRCLN
ncbi:DUF1028 domain-containing protein [Rhodococcus hoagii]|nr:DUF1028 domain-containing protein [Prescottella equi]